MFKDCKTSCKNNQGVTALRLLSEKKVYTTTKTFSVLLRSIRVVKRIVKKIMKRKSAGVTLKYQKTNFNYEATISRSIFVEGRGGSLKKF